MTGLTQTPYGDAAVMLTAPEPGNASRARVRQIGQLLQDRTPHGVTDYVAGLDSLLIRFDPLRTTAEAIGDLIALLDDTTATAAGERSSGRHFRVPVLFDSGTGPDLATVAAEQECTPQAIIDRVTSTTFSTVLLAAGMAPMMEGGTFDAPIRRAAQPRTNVPAGSIMIAGQNAIIQPFPGPTGWRVIGRTPHTIVDISRPDPAAIRPGDTVEFVAIDRDSTADLEGRFLAAEQNR